MDISNGQIVFGILFTFVVTVVIVKLSKRQLHHELRARDVTRGHRWCYTGMFSRPSYCNICETLIMASDGAFCDSCGVCADSPHCIKKANKKLPCKVITTNAQSHKHHWVKGNLPFNAQCDVCEEECGVEPELTDFWCCWCHRSVHDTCLKHLAEVCDLGKLSTCIVPPNCIRLQPLRMRKHLLIKEVHPTRIANWSPIIVVGNQNSGSNECTKILSSFRLCLNPAQVIDIAEYPPETALEWCHLVPSGVRCRVVVAGGDGTVGWVLNTIRKMNFETEPVVAILPLGTGNDLSRVLNFGAGYQADVDVEEYLRDLAEANITKLDRWKVLNVPNKRSLGSRLAVKETYMNNYLSIGVDALVTLNFDLARKSKFYILSSRTINKLIYFMFGTKDILDRECKDLDQKMEVWMDGVQVDLPSIESIVVLNIACWGAGVRPWTLGAGGCDAPKQDFGDGKLEVFCVLSSFHIAQLQVGLSEPVRLGQCSSLKICLKAKAPMQVDGEPWKQGPSTITINHDHQASVLMRE